jgi:hypothetical protein
VEGAAGISRGLGLSFEQYRQRLREEGVEFADLTGQAWSVDRADFECADTPRAKLGIETPVIESCDRPVVTVHGECVQKARGLVVRPPQGAGDE